MAMSDDEPIEDSNSEDNFIDFYYESKRLVFDQEYAEGGKFIMMFPLILAYEKWNIAKEFYRRNELPGILMIRKKHFEFDIEHLRDFAAIIFYTGSCKPFDRLFAGFVGECIAWKLDYKNDLGLMKFISNSQTRRGNNSTDITPFSFTIPVPKELPENYCYWRPQ